MNFVIFGLSVSSSWGNGHASLWRGLIAALTALGHRCVFFERDVPYYAAHRDLQRLPDGARLHLYADWDEVRTEAARALGRADVAILTSYCPDALAASEAILTHPQPVSVFYDLDSPVTLARLAAGESVPYVPPSGLSGFDLVLSYAGGAALELLGSRLGARRVLPLYGWVDPASYRRGTPRPHYRSDLSYIGTYAADRQDAVEELFLGAARAMPEARFAIAGAQYPRDFPWTPNTWFVHHLPPGEHPDFFASTRLTLNVTRDAMRRCGWCPSGRLFEAAACGTPVISDAWDGIETFFTPGSEILLARETGDVLAALRLPDAELAAIGERARARVLDEHTALHRARTLIAALGGSHSARSAA